MTAGSLSVRAEAALRLAFILGVIADAGMVIIMLVPELAVLLWGLSEPVTPLARFALAGGAALMSGWTLLLLWALRRPVERRGIAPLTVLVILGLAAAQVYLVAAGLAPWRRIAPSWVIQAVLAFFFLRGYLLVRRTLRLNEPDSR